MADMKLCDLAAGTAAAGIAAGELSSEALVGKAYLVSRLQVLLQGHRLHYDKSSREAETLTRELLDYEIRVDQDANDKYGAFKVGTHDNLVTALGLAVLRDAQPQRGPRGPR